MPLGPVSADDQLEFSDQDFRLFAKGDQSKKLAWDLSGFTTGQKRTLTPPDADGTVVTTAATQTLSNKTLASPLVTGLLDLSAASAGQIKFPATQNASSDANTLDDYEEGTFTAGMAFNGSASGVAYGARVGWYVKVGINVYVYGDVTLTNNGSGSGQATFTGMPFTSDSTYQGVLSIGFWSGTSSVVGNLAAFVNGSATTATITMSGAAASPGATDAIITNTGRLIFSGWYKAAA